MATTKEYIEFVCDQIQGFGEVRYRKMFGEYMAYVNDKPVLLGRRSGRKNRSWGTCEGDGPRWWNHLRVNHP